MGNEKEKSNLETRVAVLETRFEAILKTYEGEKQGSTERHKAIHDKLDSNANQVAELRNDLKGKVAYFSGIRVGVFLVIFIIFSAVKEGLGLVPMIKNLFNN